MSKVPADNKGSPPIMGKVLSVIVVTMMIACCFIITGTEESVAIGETSGTCGPSLNWSLDTKTGHLTITGTGVMDDYDDSSTRWGGHQVRSVSFPDGMTGVGDYAFYQSDLDSDVVIPDSVATIGLYAFNSCSLLPSISFGTGLKLIGAYCFDSCYSLTSLVIPGNVTTIGIFAFKKCFSLTDVSIGAGVESICHMAFMYCSKLQSITIPDSVTTLDSSFDYCSSMTEIRIGTGLSNLNPAPFSKCNGLTSFTVAEGNGSFCSVDGVLYDKSMSELISYPAAKSGSTFEVPSTVTSIRPYAFAHNTELTSVTLPDGVTGISERAFENCTNLTSVNIHDNITSIGYYAFLNCIGLTGLDIGEGVSSIGPPAFEGCNNLSSFTVNEGNTSFCAEDGVLYNKTKTQLICYPTARTNSTFEIPATVTLIKHSAFSYNTNLVSVTIPESMVAIETFAFANCTNLSSITIPDSVTGLGAYAFEGCSDLTTVTLGNGIEFLEYGVFTNCSSLQSITIPDSVLIIHGLAFSGCSSLTEVNIGSSVYAINDSSFYNCPSITSFNVKESNNSYASKDGVLFSKTIKTLIKYTTGKSDSTYTIPDTVMTIRPLAFQGARNLTSLTIPSGVTTILDSAFSECTRMEYYSVANENVNYCAVDGVLFNKAKTSLVQYPVGCKDKTYSVPDTVTEIRPGAFNGCRALTSVELPDDITEIDEDAFTYTNIVTVHIPASLTNVDINAFNRCFSLESFSVSPQNPNYCSVNGVLYLKDKSQLICCPVEYKGPVKIPAEQDELTLWSAVAYCRGITEFTLAGRSSYFTEEDGGLVLSNTLETFPSGKDVEEYTLPDFITIVSNDNRHSFYGAENLKSIDAVRGNIYYSSKGGCLYDASQKVLYACPAGLSSYESISGLKVIEGYAFSGDVLKEVTFKSDSDVLVRGYAFHDCTSLKKIVIEDGADIHFAYGSICFSDDEEHTIYVVAPEGYTIDETCFKGNVKIIYGEPPSNGISPVWFIVGGVIGAVILAGAAIFLIRRGKIAKGGIE